MPDKLKGKGGKVEDTGHTLNQRYIFCNMARNNNCTLWVHSFFLASVNKKLIQLCIRLKRKFRVLNTHKKISVIGKFFQEHTSEV